MFLTMRKNLLNKISIILLLCLTIFGIVVVIINNNQSIMSVPLKVEIIGEYSFDGKEWFPLNEKSDISAFKGKLIIKGHFDKDIIEGARFNFYRNHIGVSVYINGQLHYMDAQTEIGNMGIDLMPSMCGKHWTYFLTPNISQNDEIEVHLVNYHNQGNKNAYRDMLNTLNMTPNLNEVLESYLNQYIKPFEIISVVIIIIAIMLIGASMASFILKSDITSKIFKKGLFVLFVGGYFLFDTMFIFNSDEILAIRTYGRQICIMNAVYLLGVILKDELDNKFKANIALGASYIFNFVIIVLAITNTVLIYDTQLYWILSQLIICPILLMCIGQEILKTKNKNKFELFGFGILIVAILLDIANIGANAYFQGIFSKSLFIIIFSIYLLKLAKNIILNYHAKNKNQKLQQELESSKIDIMLSQIQPHFLFNSLTTVMDLCDNNPKQAKVAIADFADYLRGNLSTLKEQKLISLKEELEHIKRYLKLEKLRFKENLKIEYNINIEDIMIPTLTIQPLVENAVKHGVGKKEGKGTITITTQETDTDYIIEVKDDGAGFEDKDDFNGSNSHIGIKNVGNRLKMMINARLEIKSVIGKGTTAYVFIPKRRN